MPSKRVMRGGNANVRPIEYYGGNSGRYFENPAPSSSEFAYGGYHPVSHGVVDADGNMAGPNIGVFNVGGVNYSQQTGGTRQRTGCVPCGCSSRAASRSRSRSRSRSASRSRSRSKSSAKGSVRRRSGKKGKGKSGRRGRGRRSSRRRSRVARR
jgi:hypothetical protein